MYIVKTQNWLPSLSPLFSINKNEESGPTDLLFVSWGRGRLKKR
jgi:hypothetical protein